MVNRLPHLALAIFLALIAAGLQVGLLAAFAPKAPAATFNYPGPAPCNTTLQACLNAAINPGDVVNIQAGTYITSQIVISHAITLHGAGPGTGGTSTVLRPDGSHGVILVANNLAAGVVISGLTVMSGTNATDGAGIDAGAGTPLTLVNVDVLSNTSTSSGGGIFAGGALTMTNVNVVNNQAPGGAGGGLRGGSTALITGGRFERNTSLNSGGGLRVTGALAMTGVTVISNTSTNSSNGDFGGNGGGVRADGGLVMLGGLVQGNTAAINGGGLIGTNATISGTQFISNAASLVGGAANITGTASISGALFSSNRVTQTAALGGAVWVTGTAIVNSSTFLSNTAGFGSFNTSAGGLGASDNLTISGGTFQGNTAVTGSGVRGLGSVNATGTLFSGNGSLNDRHGGGIAALTVTVTSVTMTGNTVCCTDASGGAITATVAFISDSVFLNNSAFISGGAVIANSVFVTSSQFLSNTQAAEGGAIWTRGGSITGTQFIGNGACCAEHAGGALFSDGSILVYNSTFTGNDSDHGGAIFLQRDTSEIHDSTFDGNFVSCCGGGGAIDSLGFGPLIFNSSFTNNFVTCCDDGGAVRAFASLDVEDSQFTGNHTGTGTGNGGAIFIPVGLSSFSQISHTTFVSNSAFQGGAVSAANLELFTSSFVSNTAAVGGGGLFVAGGTQSAEVDDSTFDHNRLSKTTPCEGGGAIETGSGANLSLLRSTFTDNSVSCLESTFLSNVGTGGAVQANGPLQVARSRFSRNSAGSPGGGAIFVSPTTANSVNIQNSLFNDNVAQNSVFGAKGAALVISGTATAQIVYNTFAGGAPNNTSAVAVFAGTATLVDNILADHKAGIERLGGTASEDFNLFFGDTSNLSGTVASGGSSLNGAPRFVNAVAGDYHLAPGSAAIDRATDVGINLDFDGDPRPIARGFDIGFDEANARELFLPLVQR